MHWYKELFVQNARNQVKRVLVNRFSFGLRPFIVNRWVFVFKGNPTTNDERFLTGKGFVFRCIYPYVYAWMVLLYFIGLKARHSISLRNMRYGSLPGFFFMCLWEWVQFFTSYRYFNLNDRVGNLAGLVVGLLFFVVALKSSILKPFKKRFY